MSTPAEWGTTRRPLGCRTMLVTGAAIAVALGTLVMAID